ncbi:MAG: acetyltransferase [Moritella sp.]|jgi:acetyltransferase
MDIIEVQTLDGIETELNDLLTECVESGASVGFLTPFGEHDAREYWQMVARDLEDKSRKLFIAKTDAGIVGAVQLSVTHKPNGSHRGEVEKLMVHVNVRGQGIGKLLLSRLELTAKAMGRDLLVLDTRLGDVASELYRKVGYTEAGQIPNFARSSSGQLEATVYFYKQL